MQRYSKVENGQIVETGVTELQILNRKDGAIGVDYLEQKATVKPEETIDYKYQPTYRLDSGRVLIDWESVQRTEAEKQRFLERQAKIKNDRERQLALDDYEKAVESLIGEVPYTELSSWVKQETEARNLDKPTPMIDQLIISRGLGESREELAAKIIANADAYAVGYAQVLGEYQAKVKALE